MRQAPKCHKCQQHPRSGIHREKCGIAAPKAAKKTRQVRGSNTSKEARVAEAIQARNDAFVLGKTCIGCNTIYNYTPFAPFQEPNAKQGKYDVTKQLPNTSEDYPHCSNCLPWYWRAEAARFGMKEEVAYVYSSSFS